MKAIKVIIICLSIMLSGCAVNLNINRYALNSICIKQHGSGSCQTILVAETTAQPGYDTDQIVYLKCPYQLQYYSCNRWISPPHEMLPSLIAQSLRNTCFFRAIVTAPFAGESHYRLETKLVKLQQEFFCCPSQVRMVLHAVLIDSGCHQAIGERVFEAVVPAPQNNPCGGVIAANQATRIILTQLANFVICTVEQNPPMPVNTKEKTDK